jgi:alpha-galactosidase
MANFGQESSILPFSFKYGGHSSADLLKTWNSKRVFKELDELRTQQTLIYTDSKTGLEVRCVVVEYKDFPTVEWTVYFKNTGSADTPLLENIQALDIHLERRSTGEFLLHHHVGSPTSPQDYRPLETVLGPNTSRRITTSGGRPVNSDFPYFNVVLIFRRIKKSRQILLSGRAKALSS